MSVGAALLVREECWAAVIDAQAGFLDKLEPDRREPLRQRVAWLTGVAARLDVPVLATVETPDTMGPVLDDVARELPGGAGAVPKTVFGLGDDPVVREHVGRLERGTAVLMGMETDVCVAHSAFSLRTAGHRVVVVADCVQAPGVAHDQGLARLGAAGFELLSAKAVFYDWLRTVDAAQTFGRRFPELAAPAGMVL